MTSQKARSIIREIFTEIISHDVRYATGVPRVKHQRIFVLSVELQHHAWHAIDVFGDGCATHVESKRQRLNLIIMFSDMLKNMGDVEFAYVAVTRECHRRMSKNTPAMSAVIVDTWSFHTKRDVHICSRMDVRKLYVSIARLDTRSWKRYCAKRSRGSVHVQEWVSTDCTTQEILSATSLKFKWGRNVVQVKLITSARKIGSSWSECANGERSRAYSLPLFKSRWDLLAWPRSR